MTRARPADLADQHRHGHAVGAGRARPRVHRRPTRCSIAWMRRCVRSRASSATRDTSSTGTTPKRVHRCSPRYVSTVDSGNLAGALIALAQGLLALEETPQTRAQRLEGLADTADSAGGGFVVSATSTSPRREILTDINRLARALATTARAAAGSGSNDEAIAAIQALARQLAAAVPAARTPPGFWTASEVAYWSQRRARRGRARRRRTGARCRGRARACRANVGAGRRHAVRFPLRPPRAASSRSATVSPDADGPGRLDASFYDLLASEARLASFVAIAKGDVPQHHWFHLGRLVTNVDGRATLMSWGGTMFEYLMPQLLMRNFPGTLLDQSCRASVRRQIEYGQRARRAVGHLGIGLRVHRSGGQLSVPGVRRARTRTQARAGRRSGHRALRDGAGQPGRSRGRRGEFRAARRARPRRAIRLLRGARLQPAQPRSGCRTGRPSPVPSSCVPTSRITRACRSSRSPTSSATTASSRASTPTRESRRPSCCSRSACRARPSCRSRGRRRPPPRRRRSRCLRHGGSARRTRRPCTRTSCRTDVYTTAVTNAGGGYSMWRDIAVTRRREDPTSDAGAHFIYLRDPWSNRVWSATHLPVGAEADQLRRRVRSRQDHVPASRRRHRDAARDHGVVGRRCARCGG